MTTTDFLSSRFHYTFGVHAPMLAVQSGATVRVTCPDCDNRMADGTMLSDQQKQAVGPDIVQGNPMAGPIHVQGAEPGDTLAVTIHDVELESGLGRTLLMSEHGLLPDGLLAPTNGLEAGETGSATPRHMYEWAIDTSAGIATISNPLGGKPLSLPLDPFVGCIGVCPAGRTPVSSLYCGDFGGNYDLPLIRPGVTVYLPVNHDGGLLMMGDIHAAQGHGEVIGGGVETAGAITCTIELIKDTQVSACRLRDADHLWAIGLHKDLRQAIQAAYARLLEWLAAPGVVDRYDLYNLLSQCAAVTVGNLNEAPYPVAVGVRIDRLPSSVKEAIKLWLR